MSEKKSNNVKQLFDSTVKKLCEEFDLTIDVEHEQIVEFFSEMPLFKLLLGSRDDKDIMVVTFHVELDAPDVVQWYKRIWKLVPEIEMTASYIEDDNGSTYLGEDAKNLVMQRIEDEFVNSGETSSAVPITRKSGLRVTTDPKDALMDFQSNEPKKGDTWH